jgi:putative acetyltransferase
MIEIRGQQATDWRDVYELRTAMPYVRPDWVRDELARLQERAWPMVAVVHLTDGPKVVARVNLQLGWGRRSHAAWLMLEQHPDFGAEPGRQLLTEAIKVAEHWWVRRRLQTTVPETDKAAIALFESLGFVREAQLRQAVRIAGRLVDEVVLARVTGDTDTAAETEREPFFPARDHRRQRCRITIRGGGADDWEAFHAIWSQPNVIWGTMQMPYPSADRSRERVQDRTPARSWPLVAEVDGKVVGNAGLSMEEHNRAHAGHIGMMVDTAYQGMGVGSALLEAGIDLAENWLGLTRLQLEVYPDNGPAIQLYEKHGFEREGLCRAYGFRGGRYVDALVMGRLKDR